MRFNYMLPKNEQIRRCPDNREHYYVPTSHTEASIGHIAVRFKCKYCGQLATAFLPNEQYEINKKLIKKHGGNSEVRT